MALERQSGDCMVARQDNALTSGYLNSVQTILSQQGLRSNALVDGEHMDDWAPIETGAVHDKLVAVHKKQ